MIPPSATAAASAAGSVRAQSVTRARLIGTLTHALREDEAVLAAWLGGSDANARADDLSDVDLCLIAADGRVEEAFAATERALESLSPISRRYRLPSPTWHGAEQCFYQLRDAPEWVMVDLCVFGRSQEHQFFDGSRHGAPVVLFDPEGLVRPVAGDEAARDAAIRKRVEDLRARFELLAHLPVKEVQRGRSVDALAFYHSLVLRPLVDLLRIRYCPDRYDFSMRYLDADLPAEIAGRVKRLAFVGEAAEIPPRVAEARQWFAEVMASL